MASKLPPPKPASSSSKLAPPTPPSGSKPPPPKPSPTLKPPPPKSSTTVEAPALVKPSAVAQAQASQPVAPPPKPPAEVNKPAPKPPTPVFRQPTSSVLAPQNNAVHSFLPPPKPASLTPPKPAAAALTPPKPATQAPPKPSPAASVTPPKPSPAASVTPPKLSPAASVTPPKPSPAASVTPPKPSPAASVTPPKPSPAVSVTPPKPTVVTPPKPADPVVKVAKHVEQVTPEPIIRTPSSSPREGSAQRKVQFAEGEPETYPIPSRQPYIPHPTITGRKKGKLGPYSTARSSSAVTSLLTFYFLPLMFILITSPFPDFFEGQELAYAELVRLAMQQQQYNEPLKMTEWSPRGVRELMLPVNPVALTLKATRSSQDRFFVGTCVGPRFTLAYHVEHDMLTRDKLAFDDHGHAFVCPWFLPEEDQAEVSLVAVDLQTGQRKWNFSEPIVSTLFFGRSAEPIVRRGCGVPLVLTNSPPVAEGEPQFQIVYHSTRMKTHALKSTDGSMVWSMSTNVPPTEDLEAHKIVGGLVHLVKTNTLLGMTRDGYMFALQRDTGELQCETKQLFCETVESIDRTEEEEAEEEEENVLRGERFQLLNAKPKGSKLACKTLSPIAVASGDEEAFPRVFVLADNTLFAVDVLEKLDYYDELPLRLSLANVSYELPAVVAEQQQTAPSLALSSSLAFVSHSDGQIHAIYTNNLTLAFTLTGPGPMLSIVFAGDENALYASTSGAVVKFDLETREQAWMHAHVNEEDDYYDMKQVRMVNSPTAGLMLTANGLLIAVEAVKYHHVDELLGVAGVALLDRHTGELRSLSLQSEIESIGDLSIGLDGSVFGTLNPLQRKPTGDQQHEWKGGWVRFKTLNMVELARDSVCASWKRIENALQYEPGWFSSSVQGSEEAGREDSKQALMLAWQGYVATQIAKKRSATMDLIAETIKLEQSASTAQGSFAFMKTLRPHVEQACTALDAIANPS